MNYCNCKDAAVKSIRNILNVLHILYVRRKSNKEDGVRHLFKHHVSFKEGKAETPTTSNLSYKPHNQLLLLNFDFLEELKHVLLRLIHFTTTSE